MVQKAKTIKNVSKKTHKKNKRPIVVSLIAILILAVFSTIALLVYFNWPKDNQTETEKSNTSEETSAKPEVTETENSDDDDKTPDNSTSSEEGKDNTQYEGDNPNTSESLTGIINYAGISNGFVSVRVTVDQYITGTCAFTMASPTGKTVSSTENTVSGPAATYCSVDFYAGQFTESGAWKIEAKVSGDGKTGTITGEVNL